MKAPDKIYLVETTRIIDEWRRKPSQYAKNIEYINKEAMLKWAEGKMTVEGATEGIVGGYDLAMKDLIEHLNSL